MKPPSNDECASTPSNLPVNKCTLSELPQEKQSLIEKHLSLVLKANKTTNLTRIITDAALLHIEDSLSAIPEMEAAPPGEYADLGSGGGYPGIPLAIATDRQTALVESIQKKADILNNMVDELGLSSQISTYAMRIEELSTIRPASFNALTARALSSLPSLLELATPLLAPQAHFICFKSQMKEEEFEVAKSLEDKLGMSLRSDRNFLLSDRKTIRRILVFEKTAEPTIKLPRKTGLAQKRPLSV